MKKRYNFNEVQAFIAVARAGNFTRAAKLLGVTQSALSQAIKSLETHLQLRLLNRTTRSVTLTDAGERLFASTANRLDEIESNLDDLCSSRDDPAGSVRLTTGEHAMRAVLLPKLLPLMRRYPNIDIEFDVSYGLRNIVAERFDAGVRLGESIEKDMIALPIGPALRVAVAGSPDYFENHPKPLHPRDLMHHHCLNLRLPTYGNLMQWEFEKEEVGKQNQIINVRVEGQAIFNMSPHIVEAAIAGLGLAYLLEDELKPAIESGQLVRVLEDWCAPFPGYYLFYPSRRLPSPAFTLVMEALRFK